MATRTDEEIREYLNQNLDDIVEQLFEEPDTAEGLLQEVAEFIADDLSVDSTRIGRMIEADLELDRIVSELIADWEPEV